MRRFLTLLILSFAATTVAGCGATVRSFDYDQHAIRIDRSAGDAEARVFVDGCAVPGLYYDEGLRRWGVDGYTYGPSYWALDELAEDMATWGAAACEGSPNRPGDPTPAASAHSLAAR